LHVEGVLEVPGGMVLRREERVEVPEGGLDRLAEYFGEPHGEVGLPHLRDDLLHRVPPAWVELRGARGHVERPQLDVESRSPDGREDLRRELLEALVLGGP